MDSKSLGLEYEVAMKLSNISKDNLELDNLFLTPIQRNELAKTCIDVKIFFDWNFNFLKFYETIIKYRCSSLEFYWILHVYQIMPFETYILSFYSQSDNLKKLINCILKLCGQDFEEHDAQYFLQTGILSFFVRKAFPVTEVAGDEKMKEVSLSIIKSLLQDLFSTDENEIKTKRFDCVFALWVSGLLEERSLSHFCSFALDFYIKFNPITNDLDAFEMLGHSSTSRPPYHLLTVIEKLVKIQKSDEIIRFFQYAVQKTEINAKALLVIVKAFLETHEDGSLSISKFVSALMNEAYSKFSYEILLRSLLIGYQASYSSNISLYVQYRLWLQSVFRECNRSKDRNSFTLLIQVLSDIVPYYKDIECIKVAIDSNFHIPPELQSLYDDYIILLKTRYQDLKPSTKQEVTVEKALLLFETLGKIPPVILEISLLQKQIFLNEFLPALLIPRVVPPVPDVKERFIDALFKAGKIPSSILQKYKDGCLEKQNKIIEDINMIDENFDDFVEDCI